MIKSIAADEVLVAEVLGGDSEAFQGLIERYLPMIQSIGIARGRNASDVDNIVQETFIKAFGSLGTLRDRSRFKAWLTSIARNVAATILITWVYNNTKSVLVAILMHSAANATFNYLPLLPEFVGQLTIFWVFIGLLWLITIPVLVLLARSENDRAFQS
jgi:hypothetical protein